MRKILIALIGLTLFLSGTAVGSGINGNFLGKPIVKVTNDGKPLIVGDTPAFIENGNTMAPLYMLRQMGFQVTWEPNSYTVDVSQPKELSEEKLKEISRSVGMVIAYDKDGRAVAQGSAFVIDTGKGYNALVTNYHVAGGSSKLEVTLDNKTYTLTGKLFENEQTDVYGVRIDGAKALPYDAKKPLLGTHIVAIGYPDGKYQVSTGWIGGVGFEYTKGVDAISHTAKTDNGSSGGAVLNYDGVVLAITTGALGASTPMTHVKAELDKLK